MEALNLVGRCSRNGKTKEFAHNARSVSSAPGSLPTGPAFGFLLAEILVTAADGYLYDFKNLSIAAPSYVWDTDPPSITEHDVDAIQTTNELSATWGAVAGATSYAVQVVTVSGKPVSTPLWQNVGSVTSISLSGLPLEDDTRYVFAVRAIGPNGPSVDALSNGVTVHFPLDAGIEAGPDSEAEGAAGVNLDSGVDAAEDGPALRGGYVAGGCGCRTAGSRADEGWAGGLLGLAAMLIVRRRRLAHRS